LQAGGEGDQRYDRLLRRPEVRLADLAGRDASLGRLVAAHPEAAEQVEIETKYAGYFARQLRQVTRFRKAESRRIPCAIDYGEIVQLRMEAREKFGRIRPANLGQAARIAGIGMSDVAVLEIHIEKLKRQRQRD